MFNLKKIRGVFVLLTALILSASAVFSHEGEAHGDAAFEEAKGIIESKTPCSQLTEQQLENLGDYYMEQMHPGEAHEAMDELMGGEGSESLRQTHIAMAKRIYCDDVSGTAQYGMMGMMGMGRGGMMGGNMMGYGFGSGGFGSGMMGGAGYITINYLFWILSIALIAAIIFLIVGSKKNSAGDKMKGNMNTNATNGNTKLWLLTAAIVVLLILNFGNYGMMGYGMGFGLGWLFMIAFLVLVVWLIVEALNINKSKKGGKK